MIRVLVAEDQHLIRGALLALIGLNDDMHVVAELSHGDEILPVCRRERPDVAVLDIDLPGTDGLTAAAALRGELPETKVLILTGLGSPGHLVRALEAEVAGFLRKDAPPQELADAIRRVAKNQRFLDPELVATALEIGTSPLTPRETEVLRAAAGGGTTQEIGAELYLSGPTVRNYLSNAISKLDARNRIDAIRIARDAGWI
ncbi:MAG: DNA-binding response regulator [Solirubrobacteraceae bacterium]|jgi:two-component system, NarL family, response regulator DesR